MSLFSDRHQGILLLTKLKAATITWFQGVLDSFTCFYRFQIICSRTFVVLFRNLVTLSQKSSKTSIFGHFVHFVNFHPLPAIAGRPDHMESKCLEKIELFVYQTHLGVAGEANYSSLDLLCKFTKEGL